MLHVPLSASPLPIPERFHAVRYNAARFPGAPGRGLEGGANCQRFACFLRRPEYACHIGGKRVLLQPSCSIPAGAPETPKQSWARGASVYSSYG